MVVAETVLEGDKYKTDLLVENAGERADESVWPDVDGLSDVDVLVGTVAVMVISFVVDEVECAVAETVAA